MFEKLKVRECSRTIIILCLAIAGLIQAMAAYGQCSPVVFSPASLPGGTAGNYYSQEITASGGYYPPFTFAVTSGALPSGITLASDGTLSGTPIYSGTYNFDITATDSYPCSGTQPYTLMIYDSCSPFTISPESLNDAQVGVHYSQTFTTSGGTAPYYYYPCAEAFARLSSGDLPPGLDLCSSGVLSGTPTLEGEYSFGVCVEDSSSPYPCSGSAWYEITVHKACPLFSFEPSTLPDLLVGVPFSQSITASGGLSPYTYACSGGTLPTGLSISSGGMLSGTPSQSGSFNFLLTATDAEGYTDGMSYSVSVGCAGSTGSISGIVAIKTQANGTDYLLNGADVTGTVTATGFSEAVFEAPISGGSYRFNDLPQGSYILTATVTYGDNILYDAKHLSHGCAAPEGNKLYKTVKSSPISASVLCDSNLDVPIYFNAPVVMLHGIYDCYSKWYWGDAGGGSYYDNYARAIGLISFTPNYDWWNGSWTSRTAEVLDQIGEDFSALTTSGIPPYTVLTHDMGGLVARVMGSDLFSRNSLVKKINKAYLLGVPNSGADYNARLGNNGLLGPNSIIRYFNEVYPDFGQIDVFAVAGDKGRWGARDNDCVVSTDSVFNIKRITCTGDDCVVYPAVKLQSGGSHEIYYNHNELGSPPSVEDVFNILLSSTERSTPEAPVGAIGWGTVGATSSKIGGNVSSFLAESVVDYPFTISKCDGAVLIVKVGEGSAEFRFVDPNGVETVIDDEVLFLAAPAPGACKLRVIPGQSGVIFEAIVIDNSIFGIKAYLTSQNFLSGETATVRVDKSGDWSLVSSPTVQALLYDSLGNLLQSALLTEKGSYFSGELAAPSALGSYEIVVQATGNYSGAAFSRVDFETLNVLSASHLFSGVFSDSAADDDGNGKYDAVALSTDVNIQNPGYYVVSADLYDSNENYLSHASTGILADVAKAYQLSLQFAVNGVNCSQFSGEFRVTGLKMLNGEDLKPLDVWNSPVSTQTYSASQFECVSAPLSPVVTYIMPAKVTVGTTTNVAIVGKNFGEGAEVSFDSDISVISSKWYDNKVLFASINIPQSSGTGYRSVTVKNPNGTTDVLSGAFYVSEGTPPFVSFGNPNESDIVSGTVNVTANASDDIKIQSVSFELDGVQQAAVQSFPFIWSWDTSKSSSGSHTLKATATDSSEQQSAAIAVVSVVRGPSVLSISKKGDPFRLVVNGSNFQQGIQVYINGELWTNVKWKSSGKIVIKGGRDLKNRLPKGESVVFMFVNPDGGEISYAYNR